MYGQPYIVKLLLEMPESSVNQRLGNVVVVDSVISYMFLHNAFRNFGFLTIFFG